MNPTTEAGKAHAEAWIDAVEIEWGLGEGDRETMLGEVAAIEAEAAQQALDGAALALGLLIEPTKMSRHYIEAAFARVEHHAFAAERARIADAVRGLDGECHDGEGLGCDTSPCVVNVSRAAVLAIINPEETDHD